MMTEIIIRYSVGEIFSFSKSEFGQVKSIKESKMLIGDEIEDESTLSFDDKLDIACEKSSESTICGSISEDSVVSNLHVPKKSTDIIDDAQDSAGSTIKSDTSCDDYEYLTTETTVINTTYNMISHPDNHDLGKVSAVNHHSSSQSKETTNDKSRVIVQILKSNLQDSTKAISVSETKSPIENQSTHSFRDDVFQMLSKPQSTFDFRDNNSETATISNVINSIHTSVKSVKTVTQIGSSTKIVRTRRKHGVASFYLHPKGPRLCDIKEVSSSLKSASTRSLRILHYILYDKYGLCRSDSQISNTKRKIAHFSGYPFDKDSTFFKKRENSLLKIPVQMLRGVYEAVFGKSSNLDRSHMVNNLMTFFSGTELYSEIAKQISPNASVKQIEPNSTVKSVLSATKVISDKDYNLLKKKAKSGPFPIVLLEKLKPKDLCNLDKKLEVKMESEQEKHKEIKMEIAEEMPKKEKSTVCDKTDESYSLPAYILKGPGNKLKYFPAIVRNVKNASREDLNMLHYLLYGRMEPVKVCRRNILEFSGFLDCQSQFISEVQDILKRMNQSIMFGLCKMLCLRAKTNSRSLRIAKIMKYLKAPFNPFKRKRWQNILGNEDVVAFKKHSNVTKESGTDFKTPMHPAEEWSEPENAESHDGGFRLRDFRKICSNIECSAPSDLTELNDLLFMKPSDETEIHDKILNFTRFGFHNTSVHYYYRKTLLFYMGPCIVQKIAGLLDIENWNHISSHEDLSVSILSFLMEKKNPEASPLSPPFSKGLSASNPRLSRKSSSFESSKQSLDRNATNHQESMFISTMSKSSVNSIMCSPNDSLHFDTSPETKNNSSISSTNYAEDDTIPLRDIIHHPTDQELIRNMDNIIKDGLFSSLTLGDVVKKIYQLYPLFNLKYREDFIKTETRKMLAEMRQNAVQHIKQNSYQSDHDVFMRSEHNY